MSVPHIALNAHLLSGAASYRSAGIHGYLYNTLLRLPAADPELRYTVLLGAGDLPADPKWQTERPPLPTSNPLLRIMWEQTMAPWRLARLSPDLFHGMGFALPLLWGGPSVVTIYDLSFIRYPDRLPALRRLYLKSIVPVSARRARRVLTISESMMQEIHAVLGVPPTLIDVARPGISPDFHPLEPQTVEGFRAQKGLPARFILYVGTLEPRKNLPTLLRAYAGLPQRADVKLVLAGARGWQTEAIFALIEELGLQHDLILPGYVPYDELPLWYNAADVFVYPSVYEGFGLPVSEALACGRPVIASDVSSLPEAAGPGGILLAPDDVAAWSAALATLLDDQTQRAALGRQGQEYTRQFSWEITARQTTESYRRALQHTSA